MQKTLTLLLFLLYPLVANAQSYQSHERQALLEIGAGMVHARVPHYPGSSQSNTLTIPFPTLIYRGERYRLDEDGGARTRFFYTNWMEVNLSVGGSLPVSSKDNDARVGMPKLDTIAEIGPGLIIHFFNKRNSSNFKLSLNIPVRQAISSDLKYTKERGQIFNPILYGFYDLNQKFSLFAGVSSYWATSEYHQYIYGVDQKFATASRPAYEAKSGHVVTSYSLALIYSKKAFSVFVGSILGDTSNNSNSNSPLFKQTTNWSHAVGFTYYFYQSDR